MPHATVAALLNLRDQLEERARILDRELTLHGDGRLDLRSLRREIAETAFVLSDVRNRIRRFEQI